MSPQAIVIATVISALTGMIVGYVIGRAKGRDEQWVDDYIAAEAAKAARRNRLGQFTSTKTKTT